MITNASDNEKKNKYETIRDHGVALDGQDVVIVSRRQWVIDWLDRHGFHGEVKGAVTADDIRGKYVIGALPAHLAQYAGCMFSVDYNIPFEKRMKTLTADDLDECGAKLFAYQVIPKILVHKGTTDKMD